MANIPTFEQDIGSFINSVLAQKSSANSQFSASGGGSMPQLFLSNQGSGENNISGSSPKPERKDGPALPNGGNNGDILYWNENSGDWIVLPAPESGFKVLAFNGTQLIWAETEDCQD